MNHQFISLCKRKVLHWAFLLLGSILVTESFTIATPTAAQSVQVSKHNFQGVRFYRTTIDLADVNTYLAIGLANYATQANSAAASRGDESFGRLVRRQRAAVVANGTFFSLDAQRRVMGNVISGGRFLKYSPWENYGTTLGIRPDKRLEMLTTRVDGKPAWGEYWFSLTAGPRLLRKGRIWLAPKLEGFKDPRVLGVASRAAIGFPAGGRKLILVTFLSNVSLRQEAQIMSAIGCSEALNLDGGSSLGLAKSGKIIVSPTRELTNVIAVYDRSHPAPIALRESWLRFSQQARILGPRYRVLVKVVNAQDQTRIRSLFPEAFHSSYEGRSVIQVGSFRDRAKADTVLRLMGNKGFSAIIDASR